MLIKLGQVRRVIHEMYRFPSEARRAFYIFTSTGFMKEAANSLLKMLEEPPEFASHLPAGGKSRRAAADDSLEDQPLSAGSVAD